MKRIVETIFPSDPQVFDATVLGDAIRACRTQAGLSIQEAARSIGVAKQTLSDLEAGKPTVKLELVLKIARDLGVNLFVVQNSDTERLKRALAQNN
jgi:transcriptional regulator with XRE-family HTH domain